MFNLPLVSPKVSKIIIVSCVAILAFLLIYGYSLQKQRPQAPQNRLEELVKDVKEPQVLATNSEMAIWYYPDIDLYAVKIYSSDTEGVKSRALDWFRGLQVDPPQLEIEFAISPTSADIEEIKP